MGVKIILRLLGSLFFCLDQYCFVECKEQDEWFLSGQQWWVSVEIVYCQVEIVGDEIGEIQCYVDNGMYE